MRSYEASKWNIPDGERWKTHHQFEPINGLTVAVVEPEENPDTINLVMYGTIEGVTVIAELDKTDPGARARMISLGEIIHDTLGMADITWEPLSPPSRKQGRRKAPKP